MPVANSIMTPNVTPTQLCIVHLELLPVQVLLPPHMVAVLHHEGNNHFPVSTNCNGLDCCHTGIPCSNFRCPCSSRFHRCNCRRFRTNERTNQKDITTTKNSYTTKSRLPDAGQIPLFVIVLAIGGAAHFSLSQPIDDEK